MKISLSTICNTNQNHYNTLSQKNDGIALSIMAVVRHGIFTFKIIQTAHKTGSTLSEQ